MRFAVDFREILAEGLDHARRREIKNGPPQKLRSVRPS
jgi:hypothetical protein